MKPKVFLTRELPVRTMGYLREHTELTFNSEDRALSKDEVIRGVKGKDALLCLLTDTIDEEVMDGGQNLKIIANYAVGFNNIDVEAASKRRIAVTNTPGVLTETTADMAFSLLMTAARRIVEGDKLVRTRSWQGWAPLQLLGADINKATLGIIGLGRIGKAMIKRAAGFDMQIMYWNRTRLSEAEERELGIRYGSMEDVLADSDYISLHTAYTKETHHLIGEAEIARMKKTAYLINTTRGAVIDEKALVQALKSHLIAGAGLDVYENEPQLESGLYDLSNVVLAPHLGSATIETRTRMGMIAAKNVVAACQGKIPPNLVNRV